MSESENKQHDSTDAVTKKNGKPFLIGVAALTICVLVGAFVYFSYERSNFVKTNNASVQHNMVTIGFKISGEIMEIRVKQGDYIRKGDVIMVVNPSSADSSQIDNSYVRSTIDGIVLKTAGAPGQPVVAGQTAVYIAYDTGVFIMSNIDEKHVNRIKIGQDVEITIDQFGRKKFYGKVIEIGSATLSAFSVVPSASSGTFVKTTQHVPVKIQFLEQYDNLLVGANATVRIRLK